MPVSHDALAIAGDLVELRHDLHAHPEIGLSLPRTQERVLAGLGGLGIETSTGVGLSSVTGVLTGTRPDRPADAPVVLLRADMDALPVHEDSGVPYASRVPGAMHACGHDLHTAMLVGAARILAARRDELPGDVVLMFQPGEEMHDGAALMIAEGVLDAAGRRADAAYGMHVFSSGFPTGRFVARRGPMLAAADGLEVTVIGRGGHGSAPHQALDPVPVACEIVLALQTMVTRRFGPFEPVVVGVGSLHAGEAPNVIPETAHLTASVQTWSPEVRTRFREHAATLASSIAAAHGLHAEVRHIDGYPVTVTDPDETDFAAGVVQGLLGDDAFAHLPDPLTGSEDFSRVLERVAGSFVGLGATGAGRDPATAPLNHSAHATFSDDVLPLGAAVYARLALSRLDVLARRSPVSTDRSPS